MNGQNNRLTMLLIAACAVLLIAGFAFSIRVEHGISRAAHIEATQQSPVPTPAALAPVQHKAS
jgi:hypothetical protein